MLFKDYYSPYAAYRRYHAPWYVPGRGICSNPYVWNPVIDSQIQQANQNVANTGTIVGLSQLINQTAV